VAPASYFELHIEQGPRLERKGRTIGVPRGIVCLHWYDVVVRGESNQVGPTPMEGRHDSLAAAAEMVGATAGRLGYSTLPMVSGAGHDASYVATAGPTAMIFVPSVGGRSHVEAEVTTWEHCEAGANVLLGCVLEAAGATSAG